MTYATVTGTIGTIIRLQPEEYNLLSALQEVMGQHFTGAGGFEHSKYLDILKVDIALPNTTGTRTIAQALSTATLLSSSYH